MHILYICMHISNPYIYICIGYTGSDPTLPDLQALPSSATPETQPPLPTPSPTAPQSPPHQRHLPCQRWACAAALPADRRPGQGTGHHPARHDTTTDHVQVGYRLPNTNNGSPCHTHDTYGSLSKKEIWIHLGCHGTPVAHSVQS